MNMDRLLRSWRVTLLLIVLLLSVYQLKPWAGLNVQWGFDIQGGSRVVLRPTNQSVTLEDVTTVLQNRLNIYGLRDIKVRGASDLQSSFVVVEAAGLTEDDVEGLLASQGNFEGRIANITVFTGEDLRVDKPGIRMLQDPQTGFYSYHVPLFLSPGAARRFAEVTEGLFPTGEGGRYLDKTLDLYVDGKLVNELQISSELRGREVAQSQVTGGAETRQEARENLDRMVAILMTGSLPTSLEVVSMQRVSPVLGSEFLRSTAVAGLLAAVAVGMVLYVRYRNPEVVGSILFMSLAELLITMGVASFIQWQLDLSAVAGLIITIGTGVDQEIIMTDEVLLGGGGGRRKTKEAMFVIMATFGTMLAAMLPLMFIGVGAVRGFAVTTIIGIAVGYFVTRPSYLKILEEAV